MYVCMYVCTCIYVQSRCPVSTACTSCFYKCSINSLVMRLMRLILQCSCKHTWTYLVGPDKLYKQSLDSAFLSLLALISSNSLSSTPPVYIRKVHQNTSGSAVSELMRFIHHIITYVVPATPRAINWARPLIQNHHVHCTCAHVCVYVYMHV